MYEISMLTPTKYTTLMLYKNIELKMQMYITYGQTGRSIVVFVLSTDHQLCQCTNLVTLLAS
jgi:hypothetical protein